jgi:hypothetical protein
MTPFYTLPRAARVAMLACISNILIRNVSAFKSMTLKHVDEVRRARDIRVKHLCYNCNSELPEMAYGPRQKWIHLQTGSSKHVIVFE